MFIEVGSSHWCGTIDLEDKTEEEKTVPMRLDVPKKLHGAFKAKCATSEDRPPMNRKILELMQEWVEKGDRE